MNFKIEVFAKDGGAWRSNGILFASRRKAESYAEDLTVRFPVIHLYRIVEVPVPVEPAGEEA